MKTKELKKIAEENGYVFEKKSGYVFIKKYEELVMQLSMEDRIALQPNYYIWSKRIKTVMKALIEYSETPIEEREEEKRYFIYTTLTNYRNDIHMYLHKTKNDGRLHLIDGPYNSYTQSEIDNLPPEIKGAIECGFLKKVEVEE